MNILEKHPLTAKYQSLFNKFNVNTQLRLAHFLGQLQHESGLKPIEENLRYSAKRLTEVFGKYFPTLEIANQYAMQPQKIANRVYSGRMGNGNEASGDGYRFRGRGFLQITGRNNYTALTKWAKANGIDADYVNNPDLLLRESDALIAALWFWTANDLNKYADKDDILTITKRINGGLTGINDRNTQVSKFKKNIQLLIYIPFVLSFIFRIFVS